MPYAGDVQRRNAENIGILSADFQRRHEANFAFGEAMSMYQNLPGLRGFWPLTVFDSLGNAVDTSGHGRLVTSGGDANYPAFGRSNAPFRGWAYNTAVSQGFFYRPDDPGMSITADESYIHDGSEGLTVGCWIYPVAWSDTYNAGLITKWSSGTAKSYALYINTPAGTRPTMAISSDGTVVDFETHSTNLSLTTWYFIAGRFTPSTEISVWVDDDKETNTSSIDDSIYDSSVSFNLMTLYSGTNYVFYGYMALAFVCATNLLDSYIFTLYHQTRAMFSK